MVGRTTPKRIAVAPSWGIVRDEKIHFDCATEHEMTLTWAGFYGVEHPEAQADCARCGKSLSESSQP